MAVTRIGSVGTFTSTANSGTQELSVPSDADFLIVALACYNGAEYMHTTNPDVAASFEGTTMTVVAGADASSGGYQCPVWYVPIEAGWRGADGTFAWDYFSTPTLESGGQYTYAFYKGPDTVTPVRDSDAVQAADGGFARTVTGTAGDLIVAIVGCYNGGGSGASSWTNASEVKAPVFSNSAAATWAEATASGGDVTITGDVANSDDGGIVVLVLAPAALSGQFARPSSTIAAGSWTATGAASLHAAIGESVASDAEHDRSAASPVADTLEVGLSSVGTPDAGGDITVRVRARVV